MSIYDTCETVFLAYQTSTAIPYAAVEYDPGSAALPDKFFIYRVTSDTDTAHYDNKPKHREYTIQTILFMKSKADLKTWPDLFDTAMITAGWLASGNGRDSNQLDSGHYSWTKEYKIYTTR